MKDPIIELFKIPEVSFFIQIITRIFLSVLFSIFLGVERANKRHAAGLRTFIVVSLTGTISSLIDSYLMRALNVTFPFVSSALAIGLAIISSYTIIYSSKNQIKGLTTSVSLYSQAFMKRSFGRVSTSTSKAPVVYSPLSISFLTHSLSHSYHEGI